MKEKLKKAFEAGQQWGIDANEGKSTITFEQWYEVQTQESDCISNVSGYYYLKDGDDVRNGDEYYDYDEAGDWVTIKDQIGNYKHDTDTYYKARRKI